MDYLRLAFGFLMFHRRTIVGILLLVGLYYFITDVVPRISKSRQEQRSGSSADLSPNVETELPESAPVKAEPESMQQLLLSSDPDKLIKELMRLKDLSRNSDSDSVALVVSADILKVSKRILELELDLTQRKYVLGSLAESMLMMRLLNIDSKSNDDTIDSEFLARMEELLKDRDPIISSFAASTLVTSAVFEFHVHPSAARLNQVEEVLNRHYETIGKQPEQLDKICQLILRSSIPVIATVDTQPFLDRLVKRFLADPRSEIQNIGRAFEGAIAFRKLNFDNLIFEVKSEKSGADEKVDLYFNTLEQFPNASIPIYQTGLDAIREYLALKKVDRALELTDRIATGILSQRTDEASRQQIRRALDELVQYAQNMKNQR